MGAVQRGVRSIVDRATVLRRSRGTVTPTDRAEITQLLGLYANYWEAGDGERWAQLFAKDGRFFDVVGRDALAALCHETTHGRTQIHAQVNTVLFRIDRTHIHGFTNVIVGQHELGVGGSATFTGYGDYDDVFVVTREGWRFQSRQASSHLSRPLPSELAGRIDEGDDRRGGT